MRPCCGCGCDGAETVYAKHEGAERETSVIKLEKMMMIAGARQGSRQLGMESFVKVLIAMDSGVC